jgi:hypothetical protein
MTGTIDKAKRVAPGWYESGARAGFRQWWDGRRWHDTYWPRREGVQSLAYAPHLPRVDISSPYGPVTDIVGEAYREEQIVAALGFRPALDEPRIVMAKAELIPEPDNPHDAYAVAVRIGGHTVGYLAASIARAAQWFVAAIVQGGAVPVVDARIWAVTRNTRRGFEVKSTIRIALPDPSDVFPKNTPPAGPYTIAPRGRKVQVSGEDRHLDYLTGYLSPGGTANLLFTLKRNDMTTRNGIKSVATVLLDNEPIGELSPTTSKNALPLIDAQRERGLTMAVWGKLAGSRVAVEVTLSIPRATDVPGEWLDGPPVTVPHIPDEITQALPAAYSEPTIVPAAPTPNSATWVWIAAVIVALVLLTLPYVGWVLAIGVLVGAYFAARFIRSQPPRFAVGKW